MVEQENHASGDAIFPGRQQINFATVILVLSKAFVNLSFVAGRLRDISLDNFGAIIKPVTRPKIPGRTVA
jgi:hypothetical protein